MSHVAADLRRSPASGFLARATIAFLAIVAWSFGHGLRSAAGEFSFSPERPAMDRWMYPFNFQPGSRPVAPTYGSFDPRFDARDAQFLVGWDTAGVVATNLGPARYLIRRAEIVLTSVPPNPPVQPFVYDPTYDPALSYFGITNRADAIPDADPGRPIELYGMGFRGGFDLLSFQEASPYGAIGPINSGNVSIETRNAYAATFNDRGELIDISNHAAQIHPGWTNEPFDVRPWAVGTTTNAAPGEAVPADTTLRFTVDLGDPLIAGYLQQGLDLGRLRFVVSCLSPAGQSTPGGTGAGGAGAYPWWATKENLLYDAPRLELTGVAIGPDDADGDGLPDDWERFWWPDLAADGTADADLDGSTNAAEYRAGTDPTSAASVLRLEWRGVEAGLTVLRFPLAPSRVYRIETSSDLREWIGADGAISYPDRGWAEWRGTVTGTAIFFRVRAE